MSQNNHLAYLMFKKEKSYLAWCHTTTSQCRLTWNRREDYKVWCRLQTTLKALWSALASLDYRSQ